MATFIDTQGSCFLCSKILALDDEENEGEAKLFNFQFICHRLKINAAAFTGDRSKDSIGYSAIICSECYKVTNDLSKLCEELEMIRMKVEDALIPFHDLLSQKGNISSRRGQVVTENLRIAKLLRMETQRKCFENFKMARVPSLVLPKLETENSPGPNNTATPTVRAQDLVPSVSLVEFPVKIEVDQEEEWEIPSPDHSDAGTPWTYQPDASSMVPEMESPKPGTSHSKVYMCNHCPKTFNGKPSSGHRHLISVHPEKLFPANKMEHVTDHEFRCCCKLALEQLASLVTTEETKCLKTGRNTIYRCPYCKKGDRPLSSDKRAQQRHMIMQHYDLLCDKLKELQMRKDSLNMKPVADELAKSERNCSGSTIRPNDFVPKVQAAVVESPLDQYWTVGNDSKYICNLCSGTCVSKDWKVRHLISMHPDKLFPDESQLAQVSDHEFRCCCKLAFQEVARAMVKRLRKGVTCYQCPHCKQDDPLIPKEKQFPHILQKHYSLLCQQLEELQKRKETLNLEEAEMEFKLLERSIKLKDGSFPTPWKCNNCGRGFTESFALYRHQRVKVCGTVPTVDKEVIAAPKVKIFCELCKLNFSSENRYIKHTKLIWHRMKVKKALALSSKDEKQK